MLKLFKNKIQQLQVSKLILYCKKTMKYEEKKLKDHLLSLEFL